ncbi:MAG: hypothetical protein KatS3mg029_0995 [Saprospiraceae bacterium]|nr:MAG: hypothetical protein KatS3mg029_0995 [Saprospiraceae bacterium]
MYIEDNHTIGSMQAAFSSMFPWLRLTFYQPPSKTSEKPPSIKLSPTEKVGNVRATHNRGYIRLDDQLTVKGLLYILENIFGLYAQVERNSFGRWQKIPRNDPGTLKEHNVRGFLTNQQAIIS